MKQNSSENIINKILTTELNAYQCLVLSLYDNTSDKKSVVLLRACGKRIAILMSHTYDFYLYHQENISSRLKFERILNTLLAQYKHSRLYLYNYPYKKKIPFVAGSIYSKECLKNLLIRLPNYKENLYELKVKSGPVYGIQLFSFDFYGLKIILCVVYFYM